MDILGPIFGAFGLLTDPINWVYIAAGLIFGVIAGAFPGIGTTLAYGLVLPFTFLFQPGQAICFLLAISVGTAYGNSIPAILLGIPGTPAAIMTVLDGYALHKRGEGGVALGTTLFASIVGQTISILLFVALVVPLTQIAYYFLQPEQFALYLLGIVALAGLTGKNVVKGIMAAAIGFMVGIIGLDPVTPIPRFEFGIGVLRAGVDVAPAVIGFLALSELFRSCRPTEMQATGRVNTSGIKFPWAKLPRTMPAVTLGTLTGTFIGAIPGAGGTPAALVSYQQARVLSKHPEEFGKGSIEGIAANEAAQNAANSGEAAPTFALGIPGSGSMVLLLSALTVHGFVPGPMMIQTAPHLFYAAIAGMLGATIVLMVIGWYMALSMLRVVTINRMMVNVLAIMLVLVGVFSLNGRLVDIYVVIACGTIGYFMLRYGYSTAAAALACVLGGELERNLRLGLNLTNGDFIEMISRPYTALFLSVSVVFLAIGIYQQVKERRLDKEAESV